MADIIRITDRLSYIKATENPLSADVGIFEGDEFLWTFDIGADISVPISLNAFEKPKKAVLSHFHPDHTANIDRINLSGIYLGANTFKYIKRGTVVANEIFIDDGERIHIFPLPSSHAKGSLGMEIGDFAFIGDAVYSTMKQGKICYNASVLREEIAVLRNLSAKFFLISHDEKFIRPKDEIIGELEEIYSKRNPKESYIWI